MADDVDLRPVSPFYRIRFDDGRRFDCTGDPAAMRAEVARFSPGDVEGYERFMRCSEEICRIGFEQLGDVPFDSILRHGARRARPAAAGGYRSVYGLVVALFIKDERLRIVVQLPSAADRRQSVPRQRDLLPDPYLERRWGVHFAMGGTGALVAASSS